MAINWLNLDIVDLNSDSGLEESIDEVGLSIDFWSLNAKCTYLMGSSDIYPTKWMCDLPSSVCVQNYP